MPYESLFSQFQLIVFCIRCINNIYFCIFCFQIRAISEIGELERVLLISQQIDPLIEKINYLLELLESELDLLYQTSTNRMASFLTVLGLVLAGWQVLLAIM